MKAFAGQESDVRPAGNCLYIGRKLQGWLIPWCHSNEADIIDGRSKCQCLRTIADDEDRPEGKVLTGSDAVEVDERNVVDHRLAQAFVIRVMGIRPAIAVGEKSCRFEAVVVGRLGGCGDGKPVLSQDLRFEDPLGTHQRNSHILDDEPFQEAFSFKDITENGRLFAEPFEGGGTDGVVGKGHSFESKRARRPARMGVTPQAPSQERSTHSMVATCRVFEPATRLPEKGLDLAITQKKIP